MESGKNSFIVCLSALSEQQLDTVVQKIHSTDSVIEIWCIGPDDKIKNWAEKKSLTYKNLTFNSNLLFLTPDPDIAFNLPENFASKGKIYFALNGQISSDNYLLGSVQQLNKLLPNEKNEDLSFSKKCLELYLFFRQSSFFVFIDQPCYSISGDAWAIDHYLIKKLNLKKDRIYSEFYKTLLDPVDFTNIDPDKINLQKNGQRLYSFQYSLAMPFKKAAGFCKMISNSVTIVYNMVSFKLKRRFKK